MKKLFVIFSLLLAFVILSSCGKEEENLVEKPVFKNVAIEAGDEAAEIDLLIVAQDIDAEVYYIIVAQNATEPTKEQIKAGINYGDVTVLKANHKTDTIFESVILEEGVVYAVYAVLERNSVFNETIYKTEVLTKTAEDVIDIGLGTQEDPFRITTAAELEQLLTGEVFVRDAYYKLMNDIDFATAGYGEGGKSWTPIGKQTGSVVKFAGVFDGDGHTISNLYINSESTDEKWGFFAELEGTGVIQNLQLTNVNITCTGTRVGAVVGYSKGSVANVSVQGKITGKTSGDADVGGIVGYQYQTGIIRNAFSDVEIKAGGRRLGGIVGVADVAVEDQNPIIIRDCYSIGNVIGNSPDARQAGGIVGYVRGTIIERCYASGDITGSKETGGLVGFMEKRENNPITPEIKNSFYMGARVTIFDSVNTQVGSIIGNMKTANGTPVTTNLFAFASTLLVGTETPSSSAYQGVSTPIESFKSQEWLTTNLGLNFDATWEIKTGAMRPTLKGNSDDGSYEIPEVPLNINVAQLTEGENAGDLVINIETNLEASIYYVLVKATDAAPTNEQIIAMANYGDVVLVGFGTATGTTLTYTHEGLDEAIEYKLYVLASKTSGEPVVKDDVSKPKQSDPLWGGEDPAALGYYPIYLPGDLEAFARIVNDDGLNSSNAKLMANIDFTGYYGEGSLGFTPIGNSGKKYKGTFDGQNYKIIGLYINRPELTGVGLFGITDKGAVVKDLVFENANITGSNYVATLVGDSKSVISNIKVINSTVEAKNTSDSRVGGLVGHQRDFTIDKVYVEANVTGGKSVGGVLGYADYTSDAPTTEIIISNIIAKGTVSGKDNLGGVVGYIRTTLKNVVSYVTVNPGEGATVSVGAIAGYVQNRHADCIHHNLSNIISTIDNTLMVGRHNLDRGTGTMEKFVLVGTTHPAVTDSTYTVSVITELSTEWLTANTNFDMENMFKLEDGKLAFK